MIIIDRFENDIAVVEYEKSTYSIPRKWLPVSAKEGDVIILEAAIDEKETALRREQIGKMTDDLFK
ncbi:MAG TPA: DUF3006 domain-containing protein [Syntrophomonadaceae bacterium]|nr:DUF3006 domain-containing protein [Syntrophomonadaceae bacterium]HNX29062.1 DUF3006 domain-containing protein [Syntrophomonadaceae bacterium]HPR92769.1 DUF3006 domain-containing protein [Syntrophomonadaceae bacterium]